jgi:DNA-binding transcriptional regulator PaaX
MNKKQRIRIGYVSKMILGIVAVAGVISLVAIAPGLAIAMKPFMQSKTYSPKQAIDRSIKSLLAHKLIKYAKDKDGNVVLRLTHKGTWEAGIRGISERSEKEQDWDQTWRLIVFDVPESKRHIRTELRRAVGLYGFVQLQKSVWVYPYPCDNFISLVKKHLGIASDVLYMKVSYLENDKWLKNEFSL